MKKDSESIKRRTWLGGVASVGVIVAGSVVVGQRNPVAAAITNADNIAPVLEPGTGYQLTEHGVAASGVGGWFGEGAISLHANDGQAQIFAQFRARCGGGFGCFPTNPGS